MKMPHVERLKCLKLVTFDCDLESYFRGFSRLYILNSLTKQQFSVCGYIFRISRLLFGFKVMGPTSSSRQRKSGSMQLKNYWSESCRGLIGIFVTTTLEVIWSRWHFGFDLETDFCIFSIQVVCFECLKLYFSFEYTSLEYLGHL